MPDPPDFFAAVEKLGTFRELDVDALRSVYRAERLRRALALKLGRDWQPATEDFAPYPIPLPDAIGAELLAGIVAGELSGDASYQEWADRESNPEIQKLLRQNGREEIVHSQRVEAVLEILRR